MQLVEQAAVSFSFSSAAILCNTHVLLISFPCCFACRAAPSQRIAVEQRSGHCASDHVAGSRSNSPPRDVYADANALHIATGYAQTNTGSHSRSSGRRTPLASPAPGSAKGSRIPRSVNSSREPSPVRSNSLSAANERLTPQSPGMQSALPDGPFVNHVPEYSAFPADFNDEPNIIYDDRIETTNSLYSDMCRRSRSTEVRLLFFLLVVFAPTSCQVHFLTSLDFSCDLAQL